MFAGFFWWIPESWPIWVSWYLVDLVAHSYLHLILDLMGLQTVFSIYLPSTWFRVLISCWTFVQTRFYVVCFDVCGLLSFLKSFKCLTSDLMPVWLWGTIMFAAMLSSFLSLSPRSFLGWRELASSVWSSYSRGGWFGFTDSGCRIVGLVTG